MCHLKIKSYQCYIYFLLNLLGFSITPLIFLVYLYFNEIINHWLIFSVQIPKIYSGYFPHIKTLNIFTPLINNIVAGTIAGDFRWLITFITCVTCLSYFGYSLLNQKKTNRATCIIAVASLLMMSSAAHIPEIFRLATGSIIGLVIVFRLFERFRIFNFLVIILIFLLLTTVANVNSSNPYYPLNILNKDETRSSSISYFLGQKWSVEIVDYYERVSFDLETLSKTNCGIKYHYNGTMDSFFHVISPFKKIQIAPYATWDDLNNLRPDLNFRLKTKEANDIVLLYSLKNNELSNFVVPNNFYIYDRFSIPDIIFLPNKSSLLILAPTKCQKIK
jgi:hypothetical protein